MTETVDLGPGPADEPCVGTGTCENFESLQKREADLYITALTVHYAPLPEGFRFRSKTWPHDFGTYRDVEAVYTSQAGCELAFEIEARGPSRWSAFKDAEQHKWALRHKAILAEQRVYPKFEGRVTVPQLTEDERREIALWDLENGLNAIRSRFTVGAVLDSKRSETV